MSCRTRLHHALSRDRANHRVLRTLPFPDHRIHRALRLSACAIRIDREALRELAALER